MKLPHLRRSRMNPYDTMVFIGLQTQVKSRPSNEAPFIWTAGGDLGGCIPQGKGGAIR